MRTIGWLLWKDALSEARSWERIGTLVLFATAVMLTLHFSLPPESDARPKVAGGFLWAAVVFAIVLELRRSFESERQQGTLDGLRAAPIDPTYIYVAKAMSSFVVVGALTCALVPLAALFFAARTTAIPSAIGVALLGAIGLVGWGTLFAALVGGGRAGEIVLPILLFPIVVPLTIACVRLLSSYLSGDALGEPVTGFVLLIGFGVVSWGTSLLLFEYVLEE